MQILPDNPALQYEGRIDFEQPLAPVFVFPCTSVRMKFTGTFLKVTLENHHAYWNNYMGYILDGEQKKIELPQSGKVTLILAEGLQDKEHELLFFKRMDSCHTVTFYGFEIEDNAKLGKAAPLPKRRIEVYGDSVSAGEVSEAVEYVGKTDPEHQGEFSNSWYSYSWMTARKLGARIHDIAQGGIALLDHTGWFSEPDYIGMESCYDKIEYQPAFGVTKQWDFSKYCPHLVIIAIGQNDNHPHDYMAEDYHCEKADYWRKKYKEFVLEIRNRYPKAEIILTTTILCHDKNWDASIEEVCREIKDEKIHHFMYTQNGCGTPGHIRIPEAEQMSEELVSYIESLGEKIWSEE